MEQALQDAVQEAGIAVVVEARVPSSLGWPVHGEFSWKERFSRW